MKGAIEAGELRVAITYHYSLSFGGSERVLEVLAEMYPTADFFALLADEKFIPAKLKGRKITTSFLDRFPGKRLWYRHMLPLYPLAVENLDLSGYQLIISADGAATKGVLTDQDALHLCYCHSPPRSFWDQYAINCRNLSWAPRGIFALVSHYLRGWDFNAAQRIDGFIANSNYVADRIWKYYRRESTVIYPPVETGGLPLSNERGAYYFSAGRLVPAKRVDLLIAACNQLGRPLRIAGTGPEESRLRAVAGPTIDFLGRLSEAELRSNYAGCRAFLFAAEEDFGLVSVEAQACGRPVIAFGRGGSLEAIDGWHAEEVDAARRNHERDPAYTGVFFAEQTAASLEAAILQFEKREDSFDPQKIQLHARRFDTQVFVESMRSYVEKQRNGASFAGRSPSQLLRFQRDRMRSRSWMRGDPAI